MRNEKGLTLVELLAVIVILAVVGIIAFVSVSKIINNAKADAHLANAKSALEAGKIAYLDGLNPQSTFGDENYTVPAYTLQELSGAGYLSGVIKNPSMFGWSRTSYDMENSIIAVYSNESPVIFKVNLSIGEKNYIFKEHPRELHEITRENLTDDMKKGLNIKE